MAPEWTAPDISSICAEQHGNLSICSPAGLLFLNLITNLFGNSVDNQTGSRNYNPYPNDRFRPTSNLDAYYGQCNDAHIGNGCSGQENKKDEYDIIVVGAGSAGSVISSRLSEVCDLKVLLLEAGPEEPDITSVPGLGSTTGGTNIDWNYKTQPEEKSCRALKDGTCPITTGRVMGGSSAMNYLTYIRGNKKDFDSWAAAGNTGWTYKEILPYMKKFENNLGIEVADTKYHSTCGPLSEERFDYVDYNKVVLEKAFNELGLPTRDLNGEHQIGTMIAQNYARDQKRMSTNRAYIRPIRNKRPNFTVKPNCQVTKIIIDPTSKVAQGVRYVHNEKYYEAYASKEVIISAGALNSPRLLMLSGIGPKSDLEALKIPVLKDAKVGHNYHDHVTTEAFLMSLNATSTRNTGAELIKEVQRYYKTNYRVGPLAQVGPLDITAFTRTEFAEEEESVPDIQIHFDGHDLKEFYADPTNYLAAFYWPFPYYDSINVQVLLIHPKSRGHLTLNKEDPTFGAPLIYPNFFSVKNDMDTLVAGSKFMLRMENTTAFKRNGFKFVKTPVEACSDYEWGTYDYFACLYMSYTMTIFHPVGTCKMGPSWDKNAVVDPRLRVYGISHLRVVDGSIMPNITHGNTNSPIITIAEKAADMVKQDWGYPTAPLKCKGL